MLGLEHKVAHRQSDRLRGGVRWTAIEAAEYAQLC